MKTRFVRSKFALPLAVFAAGTALSIWLGVVAGREITRSAQDRFDAAAADLARKVEGRFDDYAAVLIGLRARFNSTTMVTRSEFKDYVAGLNLDRNYPGFQAVTYAPYVAAADKQHFEAHMRSDAGLPAETAAAFAIKPPGDRAGYYPLTYVEPLAGNERLLGNDLATMPGRGSALEQARDTGGLVSSGRKIRIAGRESDVGLAIRLPVYRPHQPLDTVEQRRSAYVGSVGAGFFVADMMRQVLGQHTTAGLRLRLIDAGPGSQIGSRAESKFVEATPVADQQLLFDTALTVGGSASAAASQPHGGTATAARRFERTLAFELGGHSWLVDVSQDENQFLGRLDRAIPWLIVYCGLAISTLLAGILYSLTTARGRAQVLAVAMTNHLRNSERQLEEAQHLASVGSWVLDIESGAMYFSAEAQRLLGFDPSPSPLPPALPALLSRVPEQERDAVEHSIGQALQSRQRMEFEHQLLLPDGTERWVHVIVQWAEEDGKPQLRGTVSDNTQRRKSTLRLKLEHEIARLLVGDGEPTKVLTQALEAVCAHLRWDCAALWRVHADGLVRCDATWIGDPDPALRQFVALSRSLDYRPDEGSLGRAWQCGDAVQVDTLAARQDFTRDALAGQAGLATGLVMPMTAAGVTLALEFFSRQSHADDADALALLRVIALQIAQYEQRNQAERNLRFVASHDALTGLSNRASLQHDLDRAIKRSNRHQKRFAVMFLDLDRFKHINDTLGHGIGDKLIKACGERLSTLLREEDVVARFGGDEFVLLLENLSKAGDALVPVEKALACCAEPFIIDGRELHVSASIGVSVYPEDGSDAESLLKNADTAMYRAKDKGCGTYQFYAAQMNAQSAQRMMIEGALRHALMRDELELHYQPKMNLRTDCIVGVEALMRWRHPVQGMISPALFIPIAEEIGLIESLGKWALAQACTDARSWQKQGLPAVQMSVNLSPRQLNSRTLISDISSVLKVSGLDPSLLELEITEGAMMKNPEHAAAMLRQIREMGIGLAIDDFGTGHSSLSYLKTFPLSTVKIDRSFVSDLSVDADAQALTDGIITLAHGLRMKVVAEGVETGAQLAYLRERGCDEIQGYWLCKPLPANAVAEFMATHLTMHFASPVAA